MPGAEAVFITGGTQGVGAALAVEFARGGFNVAVGYRSNDRTAGETLANLEDIGGGAYVAIKADITTDEGREIIGTELNDWLGDTLLTQAVLAASGGLEQGKDRETYPELVNVTAQTEVAKLFTESGLLSSAATLTFINSHQAYYLGETAPNPEGKEKPIAPWTSISADYEPIAQSKNEGMKKLISMKQKEEIAARLLIASTDAIPDTRVIALGGIMLRKEHSDVTSREEGVERLLELRRAELEELDLDPTFYETAEFAAAIVKKALDPSWQEVGRLLLPDHRGENS